MSEPSKPIDRLSAQGVEPHPPDYEADALSYMVITHLALFNFLHFAYFTLQSFLMMSQRLQRVETILYFIFYVKMAEWMKNEKFSHQLKT